MSLPRKCGIRLRRLCRRNAATSSKTGGFSPPVRERVRFSAIFAKQTFRWRGSMSNFRRYRRSIPHAVSSFRVNVQFPAVPQDIRPAGKSARRMPDGPEKSRRVFDLEVGRAVFPDGPSPRQRAHLICPPHLRPGRRAHLSGPRLLWRAGRAGLFSSLPRVQCGGRAHPLSPSPLWRGGGARLISSPIIRPRDREHLSGPLWRDTASPSSSPAPTRRQGANGRPVQAENKGSPPKSSLPPIPTTFRSRRQFRALLRIPAYFRIPAYPWLRYSAR